MKTHDLIIIGSGPAGLTAAIYAGRYLLKTLVLGTIQGGMISEAHKVCNFPTQKSITGMKLTQKLVEQVSDLGVKIKAEHVSQINKDKIFSVKTDQKTYHAKKIILATGTEKRKLNTKGEKEFLGKGVSYCATCDAALFKDKTVAVIGGSNSALTAALQLAEYAKKVYIVYRQNKFFRAEPTWVKQVKKNKKINTIFESNVTEIKGSKKVEKIMLDTGKEKKVDGVFIEIGLISNINLANQIKLKIDKKNQIVADRNQRTSIKGIFAAGDITNNPLKQAVTACAEGAIAANSAYQEIMEEK